MKVTAVCISEKKGTVKKDVGSCMFVKNYGLMGDAHAGSERQVSILSADRVKEFEKENGLSLQAGAFGENLLIEGADERIYSVGSRLRIGEVLLEITQIGKKCHKDCEIRRQTGECIMPSEGVFARILRGGTVKTGDEAVLVQKEPVKVAVITASDRAYIGAYEDKSGPLIKEMTENAGMEAGELIVLPDDEDAIYDELVRLCDAGGTDLIFTSGGTGFSDRDRVPEATMRACERNAPGIAEAVRAYSMQITPKAMFSRAASVIRGNTLIINLPGSPKAVKECLDYLLPLLEHGIEILKGEADG